MNGLNKKYDGPIVMHSNNTLNDLLNEVAKKTDKSLSTLKIFHNAKDILLTNGRNKNRTLKQNRIGLLGNEVLMIQEKKIAPIASRPPPLNPHAPLNLSDFDTHTMNNIDINKIDSSIDSRIIDTNLVTILPDTETTMIDINRVFSISDTASTATALGVYAGMDWPS